MFDLKSLPETLELPVLALRTAVLFPHGALPLVANRKSAIAAIEATGDGNLIVVSTQRIPEIAEPALGDLYPIGTLALVRRVEPLPQHGDACPVVLDGLHRIAMGDELQRQPFVRARVRRLDSVLPVAEDAMFAALRMTVLEVFTEIVTHSPTLPDELVEVARHIGDTGVLSDMVASAILEATTERQALLAELDVRRRMERMIELLVRERTAQKLREKLRSDVEARITDHQREYFLREQLDAIRKELGETDDRGGVAELRGRLDAAGLSGEARLEADRELSRLAHIPAGSPEHAVARSYLETLADLPWNKLQAVPVDLARAAAVLDEDHFGIDKVKQRILEHLAVQKLKQELKGPILCLVGPPGVGKTSVGRSIARATGRAFVRLSLGGVHDEAEIRGHRRTYVGALPGQILRGLRRAGWRDPLFMLDEIDKLGRDQMHGDPYAALLEVLDPEQNVAFRDNYLDLPFDLSRVMFVCTANVLDPVPPALLDRMEVLELPGYLDEEKLQIAERYLAPREAAANGVVPGEHLTFSPEAVTEIIRSYTHEAGVRKLEQQIGAICRKRARQIADGATGNVVVTPPLVHELLGVPPYRIETELAERTRTPGVAVALAWTPYGGDVLFVEASRIPAGRGNVTLTGHLGEVMQESAKAALTWVRANAASHGIDDKLFTAEDLHVHVPSGAVPKDGPSAGIVMVTSLVSLFSNRPVRPRVAMTGEITLSGQILPIGGIKEKLLAARRSGITDVVLPAANEPDVREEVPPYLLADLRVRFVSSIDEALGVALEPASPERTLPRAAERDLPARSSGAALAARTISAQLPDTRLSPELPPPHEEVDDRDGHP